MSELYTLLKKYQKEIYRTACSKGWHETDNHTGIAIALMHSELSEALEADRKGLKDDHIPEYSGLEAELADCIIRILDHAEHKNLDVIGALFAKAEYNKTRPYRHGGKNY